MNWEPEFVSLSSETLRDYDKRSGFDLVSCQEVGLPVYRLAVDALIQTHKQIPPIEEFILKVIDAGLSSEQEITEFLGLELSITRESMVNLRRSEDIDLVAPDTEQLQAWKLTKKGKRTLREAKIIVPEERTFEINFDGLLRRPRWYGQLEKNLLKPKDLRDESIIEIPPSPQRPPELSDLRIVDIDQIIKEGQSRLKSASNLQEQDFLALKAIDRRQRYFLPATGLVYKSKDSDEIQIAFIVDGIISNEHETAFARSYGAKKIKKQILDALQNNEPLQLAEKLLGADFVKQYLTDLDPVAAEVDEATSIIQSQIESTQEQLQTTSDPSEKDDLVQKLQEKENEILALKNELEDLVSQAPIRWLEMYDHRPLLEKALKETQERLMIISPWIRANAVNEYFLYQFEGLLKRGVKVFIGYGLGEKDDNRFPKDIKAEEALRKLSDKYSTSFVLKRLGDTHAKALISDSKFAVLTSFNWLSFKGQQDRTFRDERGTLVANPQKIDELFNDLLERLVEEP